MKGLHLKDLLEDSSRCVALTAEHNGIFLDYSRENVSVTTIDGLVELAETAGLKKKMDAMKVRLFSCPRPHFH